MENDGFLTACAAIAMIKSLCNFPGCLDVLVCQMQTPSLAKCAAHVKCSTLQCRVCSIRKKYDGYGMGFECIFAPNICHESVFPRTF